ncbi:MAG: LysR family transcriptional regulator [Oscillospiraceae bacterium]|nr:LysR family transcriptional regulator [Oscillospiraceae bacterium]
MSKLQYQLFVSVANTLNFSRTAEKFFISQPAVTHHIKMLENSLGVKLFNRTSKKIALTNEGSEFLPYANHALDVITNGEARIRNITQGKLGHIRIAALSTTTQQLTACLDVLYEKYPSIQADVDLLEGKELISSLQKGTYDFYFLIADMVSQAEHYESIPIFTDSLELFVNKSIVKSIDMTDWTTIARHPFVSVARTDTWLTNRIRTICRNRGIVPNIINYYNRPEAAIISVNTGVGIAILPGELKNLFLRPNIVALPIHGEDAKVNYSFWGRTESRSNSVALFKEIVASMFSKED